MKTITQQKVMVAVELGVSAKILNHPHGKPARLLFDYLLAQNAMRYGLDDEGYVPVSQVKLDALGIDTKARRRGLLALEEMGLIVLRQEGHGTYRAKLLYKAPVTVKAGKNSKTKHHHPAPPFDVSAYEILRAMDDGGTD
jgi:hypothetical protein